MLWEDNRKNLKLLNKSGIFILEFNLYFYGLSTIRIFIFDFENFQKNFF